MSDSPGNQSHQKHSVYRGEAASVLDLQCQSQQLVPSVGGFSTGNSESANQTWPLKGYQDAAFELRTLMLTPGKQIIIGTTTGEDNTASFPYIFTDIDVAYDTVLYAARLTAPTADAIFPASSALGGQ
ncbi:hypothetical protein Bbelb_021510 [Branchiostoma belcheri]|nr:hypothetical protein Bbelb_021510 [Branchiostoma belcheri]